MEKSHSLCEPPLPLFVAPQMVEVGGQLPSYIRNHRHRLRERFLHGGAEAMPDYELLELLLFGAIPRQDVKPLAALLLTTFGDLSSVISATPVQLRRVSGVGETVLCAIKLAGALGARLARAKVLNRHVISSWAALLDYCHTMMAHRDVEHVRALYLDRKNCLIADEELAQGTVDHVPVYPREILRRALDCGASAIILVHNHPSGDPTPSQADIAMTDRIRQGAEAMGLVLHDHLIIGREREFSFRCESLL